ncbi:TPA: hypothetical protein RUT55_003370 [Enterobacter kobei]|uniref:hypothetical protein n=1 Tax=Enterobacter kobei TaxID=208224 RepID=UPI002006B23F|nr:hypothetical protein [Enterobacter kobei]MCK7215308.1 hypothetical protein [Enterobacter kobei]HDZ8320320.1 hypothetical protein [Enterobacter kobei]
MKGSYLWVVYISLFFCMPGFCASIGTVKVRPTNEGFMEVTWSYIWTKPSAPNLFLGCMVEKTCGIKLYLSSGDFAFQEQYEGTSIKTSFHQKYIPTQEVWDAWNQSAKTSGSIIMPRPDTGIPKSIKFDLYVTYDGRDSAVSLDKLLVDTGITTVCYTSAERPVLNLYASTGDRDISQDFSLIIGCSSPSKYRISLSNSTLDLGGGITARLLDENNSQLLQEWSQWKDINSQKNLKIKAMVTIPPEAKAKTYTGSTVIYVEYW